MSHNNELPSILLGKLVGCMILALCYIYNMMYKGRMKSVKAEVAYPFIKLTYTFSQTHDGKMN